MEVYVLKSAACLGVLFLFYKLLLENTSLHTTKRFFLLGSLLVSILIPFITFIEYVEVAPLATQNLVTTADFETSIVHQIKNNINYIPYIVGVLYGLGVLFFSIRFGRNMWRILKNTRQYPAIKKSSIFHVLLNIAVTPHSFFNYIFFHKGSYEAGDIPSEVIMHETAHVEQKHSWDIVFFELLRIVFWFNPIFYFIKKSIKLNHEFMADRAVLNKGADPSNYQHILLDFSSGSGVQQLAHSINYSSIKKRFTVMKTHTSTRAAWFKGLLVLPLLAVLVYGFSTTTIVEKTSNETETAIEFPKVPTSKREVRIHVNNTGGILVNENLTDLENLENTLIKQGYNKVSPPKPTNLVAHMYAPDDVSMETLFDINEVLQDFGLYKRINHSSADETSSVQRNKSISQSISEEKLFVIMVQGSTITINGKPSSLKTFARDIDQLTKNWDETDYTSTLPIIKIASTPEEFLNKLDVEYKKTKFSKANGGLGLLPPPPPPPPAPMAVKAPKASKNPKAPKTPKAPKAPKAEKSKVIQYSSDDGIVTTNAVPPPPPPPPPPSDPLDHIIKVAKMNGTFYYEGKQITSDKAIELVKKNKDLNIQVSKTDTQNPVVKISTKPIYLKKT